MDRRSVAAVTPEGRSLVSFAFNHEVRVLETGKSYLDALDCLRKIPS
jgi:hypothetical protein